MFQQIAEMGHERILLCSNPEVGLKAIIAVHSTVLGPGLGGLRMYPFKDFEEALTDLDRAIRLGAGATARVDRGSVHAQLRRFLQPREYPAGPYGYLPCPRVRSHCRRGGDHWRTGKPSG